MRHKWYSTLIAISLVALIGSINGCTTAITQQPVYKPAITYFTSSPMSINQGQQITLSWKVTGATTVIIQPDIGNMAAIGSLTLTPDATVTYILTASNDAGSSTRSVTVNVTSMVAGKADLVITDTWLEGAVVYYKIKNRGNADANPSRSDLHVNKFKEAVDPVGPLAAGAEITASFSNFEWNFEGYEGGNAPLRTFTVKVCADVDNVVDENNESNNCITNSNFL
jgi:hypothetical protein